MVQYVRNNKQYLVCSLKNTDQLRDKVMNMSTTPTGTDTGGMLRLGPNPYSIMDP